MPPMPPIPTYAYHHPELSRRWHTQAKNLALATKRFEDSWALRVFEGLLEDVDGSFFDGEVKVCSAYRQDDLCPKDLGGHMIMEDKRPERREFSSQPGMTPVSCMLCQGTGWGNGMVLAL